MYRDDPFPVSYATADDSGKATMDPSYRQAFYSSAERDQDSRLHHIHHHPQLQQQHTQHLQHYQLPYHITSQQPPFVVDQAESLRNREDYGTSQVMLRSIYSGAPSILPNSNPTLQPPGEQPLSYSPGLQHVTLLQPTQTTSLTSSSATTPTTSQAAIFPSPPVITTSDHTPGITPLDPSLQNIIRKEPNTVSSSNLTTSSPIDSLTSANIRLQSSAVSAHTSVSPSNLSASPFTISTSPSDLSTSPSTISMSPSTISTSPSTISTIRQTVLSHPTIIQPNISSQSRTSNRNILTPSSALQKNIVILPSVLNLRGRRAKEKSRQEEKPEADLPDFLCFIFAPDNKENITGVKASGPVEKGTTFGPYEGNLLDEESGAHKESTWELCLRGKVFLYIDGKRKGCSHMMSYIQCARNKSEQNLEAIQSFGDIYFRATRLIEPGEELKVFYSEVYSDLVGFKTKWEDVIYNEDEGEFECKHCGMKLSSAKKLVRHVKFEHETDGSRELCPVVTWRVKSKNESEASQSSHEKRTEKEATLEQSKHYVCTVCGKNFPSEGRLEAHAMFHEFTEDHTCPVCGEKQRNTFMLTKHMARHVNRTHKCSKCDKAYKTRGALYRHERDMHGIPVVRNHVCRICSTRFAKKLECLKHEMTHKEFMDVVDNPKNRACKMKLENEKTRQQTVQTDENVENLENMSENTNSNAEKRTSVSEEEGVLNINNKKRMQTRNRKTKGKSQEPQDMLGKAADYYLKPRPFKCRYCTKRYVDKTKAYEHEKEVHEGKGTYKCTDCGRMFMNEARFLDHVKNHEQHRLYRCNLCPRSFASEIALNNHQGEHNGLKPFKCELCGRGFRVKNAVYQHKRRMHQTRPMRFFCNVCNKGFPDKGGLTKHERRHKGIRPFVCLVCGKGFTVKHSLQVHMQSMHEEKRPFTCHICLKTFSLNHSFTSHMFRHKVQGEEPSVQTEQQQQPFQLNTS